MFYSCQIFCQRFRIALLKADGLATFGELLCLTRCFVKVWRATLNIHIFLESLWILVWIEQILVQGWTVGLLWVDVFTMINIFILISTHNLECVLTCVWVIHKKCCGTGEVTSWKNFKAVRLWHTNQSRGQEHGTRLQTQAKQYIWKHRAGNHSR